MQRALTPVLALLAICASVFAWLQHSDVAELRSQLAAVAKERDEALASAARAKASGETAIENVSRLTAERDAAVERTKAAGNTAPREGLPPPPPKSGDESGGKAMMQGIAKMFESEEGKKMMRTQMAMGIKMQYGSLAKDLNLDPKIADQVTALLADRQADMSEMTFALMKDGTLDEAGMKKVGEKADAMKKDYDEKLRAILGDDGLAKLTDYERTSSDRVMLNLHEQQFSSAGVPLESAQREGLLQIMKEERLKTPASAFDQSNQKDPSKTFAAMKDDAAVEKWLKQEEDYQRRVLEAAPRTLNPDQVIALQQSFKQQLEMQRFGVKMSKEMFGKGASGSVNVSVSPSAPAEVPAK